MFNLAPVRYRNIMHVDGGPIDRLEYAKDSVNQNSSYSAAAYLKEGLIDKALPTEGYSLREMPDGVGTHKHQPIALFMAISEALERWALLHLRTRNETSLYGLDIDKSSNGFAAFPGLFHRQARASAFSESIERHCLMCWWEGYLGHTYIPCADSTVRAIKIDNPFSRHTVVIIWKQHSEGRFAQAFGAASNTEKALWRATIELQRTKKIIDYYNDIIPYSGKALHAHINDVGNVFERRILYFSTTEGFQDFINRLSKDKWQQHKKMRLHYDGHVKGAWDAYASVWRTVIIPPSTAYLSDSNDYFFW
jgi:hypothetical protein